MVEAGRQIRGGSGPNYGKVKVKECYLHRSKKGKIQRETMNY